LTVEDILLVIESEIIHNKMGLKDLINLRDNLDRLIDETMAIHYLVKGEKNG